MTYEADDARLLLPQDTPEPSQLDRLEDRMLAIELGTSIIIKSLSTLLDVMTRSNTPDEKMAGMREMMRYVIMTPEFQHTFGIKINLRKMEDDKDEEDGLTEA